MATCLLFGRLFTKSFSHRNPSYHSKNTLSGQRVKLTSIVTFVTLSLLFVPQLIPSQLFDARQSFGCAVFAAPTEVISQELAFSPAIDRQEIINVTANNNKNNNVFVSDGNHPSGEHDVASAQSTSIHWTHKIAVDHNRSSANKHYLDRIFEFDVPIGASLAFRFFLFVYCCLVIGYLCDEYFVNSLQEIGKALNFSNDLIGAILIPFGTSGPEIFCSVIGVFFAENDIGTGAIIGSAVFNMLAIPAGCGLAATYFIGHPIEVREAPILRDLLFYIVSVVVLVLVVKDHQVDLLDSSLLILLFILYICTMLYNEKFAKLCQKAKKEKQFQSNNLMLYHSNQVAEPFVDMINSLNGNTKKQSLITNDDNLTKVDNDTNVNKRNDEELMIQKTWNLESFGKNDDDADEKTILLSGGFYSKANIEARLYAFVEDIICKEDAVRKTKCKANYEKLSDIDDNGFGLTDYCVLRWLLLPASLIFCFTMPRRYSWIVFLFSIVYLSLLSYVTVWAISEPSYFLGISPAFSGMTILAAGSAVPDLVTSIVVIKKTQAASMGICAAIASNIFAILLGLGLPWTIRIMLNWAQLGGFASSLIVLESDSLPYTSLILLATVFLLYFTFRANNWKIGIRFAVICIIILFTFIASNFVLLILIGNS